MLNGTQAAVIDWLANGETGLSSETMAFWLAFNTKNCRPSHPHDPADFDRCLLLLERAPALRTELHKMALLSPTWERLVARWSDIEKQHLEEVGLGWTKARRAPVTYELMRSIIES